MEEQRFITSDSKEVLRKHLFSTSNLLTGCCYQNLVFNALRSASVISSKNLSESCFS